MNAIEALRAVCRIDWGSVPQWLTFVGVAVGFIFTYLQLRRNQSLRQTENILRVSDRMVAYNAHFLEKLPLRNAVQTLEGLNVPASKSEATAYWAARGVHLSDINLIWRIWELAGRPGRGKAISPRYDGWERFAREMVTKKLRGAARAVNLSRVKNDAISAEDLAGSDVWSSLSTYEVLPTKFVQWLDGLDEDARRMPMESNASVNQTAPKGMDAGSDCHDRHHH
jgi:hypothetical protein